MLNPFRTFWMAGYECSDQLNVHGNRVNLLEQSGHLSAVESDYKLLTRFGIKTVREGICWSITEFAPFQYDFTRVGKLMDAGDVCGIQQIWDICHFGYPADLTPLHPQFKNRFVGMCMAFVDYYFLRTKSAEPLVLTPINEVSFISWLGGEVGATTPYCRGNGWDVKYQLMAAYIAGVKAIKERFPQVLILSTEPLVNIVAPLLTEDATFYKAASENQLQYQANDILCGRICPELGGKEEYLDIVGLNYYYNNQYTCDHNEVLPWANEDNDERWRPLSDLLAEAYHRYNRPILLAETSHPGEDRPNWITFIAEHCIAALENNIPLLGICIYPVLDRPDWDDTNYWHNSGVWGQISSDNVTRPIEERYALAITEAQHRLSLKQNLISLNKALNT